MASDVKEIRADLIAEQEALDSVVGALAADQWSTATASPGWDVADQIAHLTYFDHAASVAISDPDTFASMVAGLVTASADGVEAADDFALSSYRIMAPDELLASWRAERAALADVAQSLDNDTRVEWYGPSMGAKSFLTARLMEAWAHGQDVVDAVGATRTPTDRLRHIAQLGFLTRGWTYVNRGEEPPTTPVRVEVTAPSGAIWTYGPDDAPEAVVGSAEDFCLVVTQRRHLDDTELTCSGPVSRDWLEKAQAFAGRPTDGPASRDAA